VVISAARVLEESLPSELVLSRQRFRLLIGVLSWYFDSEIFYEKRPRPLGSWNSIPLLGRVILQKNTRGVRLKTRQAFPAAAPKLQGLIRRVRVRFPKASGYQGYPGKNASGMIFNRLRRDYFPAALLASDGW
jgi:hypothetical protein